METITYLNLNVEGTPISKVTALEIEHGVNMYGTAVLTGEVTVAEGEAFTSRANGTTKVCITTTASGQPKVLFNGIVDNVSLRKMAEYAELTIVLKATAALLDKKKKNRSFQNTGSTYEEIISKVFAGKATLDMQVSDHATGQLIMQYQDCLLYTSPSPRD